MTIVFLSNHFPIQGQLGKENPPVKVENLKHYLYSLWEGLGFTRESPEVCVLPTYIFLSFIALEQLKLHNFLFYTFDFPSSLTIEERKKCNGHIKEQESGDHFLFSFKNVFILVSITLKLPERFFKKDL